MKTFQTEIAAKASKIINGSESRLLLFARNFFKHPRMLGSIVPSSSFLMNRVLKQIDFGRAKVIVEYGPGIGNFSTEILKRMRPDAALIVFELNPEFAEYLRNAIPDPRLHVVSGSAADVQSKLRCLGWRNADYVLSGIPFSTMPEEVRNKILDATRSVLSADGAVLIYQFSPSVMPHLKSNFARVEKDFELFNILPAHIFCCRC